MTVLRLGVGYDDEQRFEFECECGQPIRGVMRLDQKEGRVLGVDLQGAELDDEASTPAVLTGHERVVTIHPSFGTTTGPFSEVMSPFIAATQRHGQQFEEKAKRLAFYRSVRKNEVDIVRIVRSYQEGKWEVFRSSVHEFLPDWPLEKQIDRNKALYQLLDLFMAPLATSERHVGRIDDTFKWLLSLQSSGPDSMYNLLDSLLADNLLAGIRDDLSELVPRIYAPALDLEPVLAEWDPSDPEAEFPPELKIEGKHQFPAVRTLYVDAYEAAARGLTPLIGALNVAARGDCNAFAVHPTIGQKKQTPLARDLQNFHSKSHGAKVVMFEEAPALRSWIGSALDSELRNAIGHNKIRYSWAADRVEYTGGKVGRTTTFGGLSFKLLRVLVLAHQLNHFVKMLYVFHFFRIGDVERADSGNGT